MKLLYKLKYVAIITPVLMFDNVFLMKNLLGQASPLEMRNVMAPRNSIVLNLLPPGYQNKNAWKLHLKKTVNILYHCTWKMISDENWAQSLGQQFPLNFNRDCLSLLAFILEIEVFWRVWQIVWIQQSKLWNWIVQGNPRWNRRHGSPSEKGRGAHTHASVLHTIWVA